MNGDLTFFELGVPDTRKARSFYGTLFGWEFPAYGDSGESSISTATGKGGLHGEDPETGITVFFKVDDIDAAVEQVRSLGGTAEDAQPEEIGFGRFALCADDQGVAFGLHQPTDLTA